MTSEELERAVEQVIAARLLAMPDWEGSREVIAGRVVHRTGTSGWSIGRIGPIKTSATAAKALASPVDMVALRVEVAALPDRDPTAGNVIDRIDVLDMLDRRGAR